MAVLYRPKFESVLRSVKSDRPRGRRPRRPQRRPARHRRALIHKRSIGKASSKPFAVVNGKLVRTICTLPREAQRSMGEVTARVEAAVRDLITSGALPNGRLPSERTLAADLDAGRTTIRLVLMKLASEGLVRSEHGRGYFVADQDGSSETS